MPLRNSKGQFEKGTSGNPSGRPKRTDAELSLLQDIYTLTPLVFSKLKKLLEDDETPASIQFRCCEMIMNRVCGKEMNASQIMDYENSNKPLSDEEKTMQDEINAAWKRLELDLLK